MGTHRGHPSSSRSGLQLFPMPQRLPLLLLQSPVLQNTILQLLLGLPPQSNQLPLPGRPSRPLVLLAGGPNQLPLQSPSTTTGTHQPSMVSSTGLAPGTVPVHATPAMAVCPMQQSLTSFTAFSSQMQQLCILL